MTTESQPTPEELWAEEAEKREETPAAETAAEPAPVEEVAAAPEAKPEEVKEEDPYEGLPEAAKERLRKLDELERSQVQLLHQVKSAEGRVASMQRELAEAKKVAANTGGPSQSQIAAASGSLRKWDQLKSDFPEWAEAMEEYVQANKGPAAKAPENLDQVVEARANTIITKYEKQRIERKFRGWEQEVRTAEFGNWLNGQPDEVKVLADSPLSDDAVDLLSKYYAAKESKTKRSTVLAAAAGTKPGPSAPATTRKTLDELSPEELWAYEAAEREKRRQRLGA